jgi:hypothetical protein
VCHDNPFRRGHVVVTEGTPGDLVSGAVGWASKSPWTHAFMVTNPGEGTEAWFPRVRRFSLDERLRELKREGRAYAVLAYPGLGMQTRLRLGRHALGYVGRFYDIGQIALFVGTRVLTGTGQFHNDGSGTVVCSRLISAAFYEGLGIHLWPERVLEARLPVDYPRLADLRRGYATPGELLSSALQPIHFEPSANIASLDGLTTRAPAGARSP